MPRDRIITVLLNFFDRLDFPAAVRYTELTNLIWEDITSMDCIKKICKIIGILAAIAGVIAGVCLVLKKIKEKKDACENQDECYVSCSCCDEKA